MLKQLHRFPNPLEEERFSSSDLLEQTRQLFHSEGSEAELIAMIQQAIDVIQELCQQPD
jgi:hypothetical protein